MALLTFWASCICLLLCSRFPGTLLFVFLVPSTFRADSAHLEHSHHFHDYLVFRSLFHQCFEHFVILFIFLVFRMVSARAGTVLLIFRAFHSLGHFFECHLCLFYFVRVFRSDSGRIFRSFVRLSNVLSFYFFPSVPFTFRTDFARVLRALLFLTLF